MDNRDHLEDIAGDKKKPSNISHLTIQNMLTNRPTFQTENNFQFVYKNLFFCRSFPILNFWNFGTHVRIFRYFIEMSENN